MSPWLVHYVPIVTTVLTVPFALEIFARYRRHPERLHLLWWTLGVFTYGIGTLTESLTTLIGWREPLFRSWYISGALLGGAPLAQGTVYLLLSRRVAHRADGGSAVFRDGRRNCRDPLADRLHAGRGTPAHRPRLRVDVGADVQPVRQHVRRHLSDWRRGSVRGSVQRRSVHAPPRVGERPDRSRRHPAGHRRNGHTRGLHGGALRHGAVGSAPDVERVSNERRACRCRRTGAQAPDGFASFSRRCRTTSICRSA